MAPPKMILLVFCLLSAAIAYGDSTDSEGNCVYTVYIRTGSIWKAGTDSNISLALLNPLGGEVFIDNLEAWGGLMGPSYDYFERGNLDIFSGRGPCLESPPCRMVLASDGTGPHHGWYCNYVEVTYSGPHMSCNQKLFTVEQWLATDTAPYDLTAVNDQCSYDQPAISQF